MDWLRREGKAAERCLVCVTRRVMGLLLQGRALKERQAQWW